MKSNYKRLGDYIQPVNIRNKDLQVTKLLGVSIQKILMPSIANTVGTNMKTYKIIKKNQFAYGPVTSRNGDKISIALLQDFDEAIVSQAYTVFEVKNKDELHPEYLMMWMRRPEFDRYARFKSYGSAREIFDWGNLCETELPIPSIEKQREIVKEYNTIVNRIKLNEQLNQKLEETAQALYKHWFVDFEFPFDFAQGKTNEENSTLSGAEGYKSSGGKMVWNEVLEKDIPEGWNDGKIDNIAQIIDGDRGRNYPKQSDFYDNEFCLFLNAGNVTKNGFDFSTTSFITKEKDEILGKGKLVKNDIILTTRGTVGNIAYFSDRIDFENIRINSGMVILRVNRENKDVLFMYSLMRSEYMKNTIANYLSGSAQPQLPIRDIKRMPILIPFSNILGDFFNIINPLQNQIDNLNLQERKLSMLKGLLLSKMSKL